jgi:hypothetical protein
MEPDDHNAFANHCAHAVGLHVAAVNYCDAFHDYVITNDLVRAVYDAAARILNDKPADHISAADVWRLRAAYIDAHAAYWAGNSDYTPVSDAANALSAATTPTNEVT